MSYLNFKARFHLRHPINMVNFPVHIVKTEKNLYEIKLPCSISDQARKSMSQAETDPSWTVFCSLCVIDVAICGTNADGQKS